MKFYYNEKSNPTVSNWPTSPIESCNVIDDQDNVLAMLDKITKMNALIGPWHFGQKPLYRELGELEGFPRARIFRMDNGQEYSSLSSVDDRPLSADRIAAAAFHSCAFRIENPRAIRAIKVKEGDVLHLAVDADIVLWVKDPDLSHMPSYSAELF